LAAEEADALGRRDDAPVAVVRTAAVVLASGVAEELELRTSGAAREAEAAAARLVGAVAALDGPPGNVTILFVALTGVVVTAAGLTLSGLLDETATGKFSALATGVAAGSFGSTVVPPAAKKEERSAPYRVTVRVNAILMSR
jgi:hypothetical protein